MELKDKLALQKMLVGHFIESIPEDCKKGVVYCLQGDGLWEKRSNKLGTFYSHLFEMNIPGLDETLTAGFDLKVPKIPASLLGTIITFFRKIYEQHHSEAFLQCLFDVEKEEYILHCPKQVVSAGSVHYNHDLDFEAGKIQVMEIHSHGDMGAFFSGTDDDDEKNDRFFGVVGSIKKFFPDLKLRLTLGGRHYEVDVPDLFDINNEMYHMENYPTTWPEQVSKITKKEKKKSRGKHGKFKGQEVLMFSGKGEDAEDAFGNSFYSPETAWEIEQARAERASYNAIAGRFASDYHLLNVDDDDDVEEFYEEEDGKFWKVTKTKDSEIRKEVDMQEMLDDDAQDSRELKAYEEAALEWSKRNNMKYPEHNAEEHWLVDWRNQKF